MRALERGRYGRECWLRQHWRKATLEEKRRIGVEGGARRRAEMRER